MDGAAAPVPPLDAAGVSRRKRVAELQLPTSPAAGEHTSTTPTSAASTSGSDGAHGPSRKRHHITSMPKHLAFNVHVHNGYRPYPLSPVQAVASVLEWHNETGEERGLAACPCSCDATCHGGSHHRLSSPSGAAANIWTHLAPGLLCIYWVVAFLFSVKEGVHYAAIPVAHACSAVCFLGSALYHTFMVATDEQSYRKLLMFDLFGIWVVNVVRGRAADGADEPRERAMRPRGSLTRPPSHSCCCHALPRPFVQGAAIVSAQLQLPCQPLAVKLGVAFGPSVAAALWILFVAKTPATRALSFALQLAVRVGVLVVSYNTGATLWTPGWLATHLTFEAWPFIGAVINLFRWPDK